MSIASILVAFVAIQHLGFMFIEMFLWTKPFALKSFSMTAEFANASKVLAANQGLYNGFLAAGLIWGLVSELVAVQLFFLGCVTIAGVYGGLTAKKSILVIQALPGLLGLILVGRA